MNFIAVMSDEHSGQMMRFMQQGGLLSTPNLDRLAAESTVFTNCYSPCPVCAPARASFFTGQFVHRIGTWDNATPYDGTVEGISQRFADHGVPYACIGKTHFHPEGDYRFTDVAFPGYMGRADVGCFYRSEKRGRVGAEDRYGDVGLRTGESNDDRVLKTGLEWLENHKNEDGWMLYLGFLDPHFPFKVKKENWDHFDALITEVPEALKPPFTSLNGPLEWLRTYFKCDRPLPDETIRRLLVGYHAAIAELDERIGVLLDAIDAMGLKDNTALCYTSDHGEQSGYHGLWWKCNMFEESARIPLIFRVPGETPKTVSHPVNLVDLFPTFCDYMNVPQPEVCCGHSLRRLIETGEDTQRPDFTFSEYSAHGVPNSMFMVRWQQYKYVYYCYDMPQLFDLSADPAEDHDLLQACPDDPTVKNTVEECHKRLLSVCDPYEVDARAKEFQQRTKKALGLEEYTAAMHPVVPHPEDVMARYR
ncbi:MAG: sulfatase-like hydrolase/transferase [Clostridia bacterium]|nr:sulfatase-like hydrolase/transferase [Clostridia bacterium]